MLRALFERGIGPDLVLGTSVGALNGAMVARDPTPAVIERLTELWQRRARPRGRCTDRPLRTVRRAVATGHPHLLRRPDAEAAARGVRRPHLRGAAGPLPGVRGEHRAGGRALVRHRPGRRRDHGERRRTGTAAAGPGRRRALPRRRHRELDPARPRRRAGRRPGLRAPGRPRRPAAEGAAAGPGRSPGCPSRSRAATGSPASWPSCPTSVEAHVLPGPRDVGRDDSLLAHRDFSGGPQRASTPAYEPRATTWPRCRDLRVPGAAAAGARPGDDRADGRCCG